MVGNILKASEHAFEALLQGGLMQALVVASLAWLLVEYVFNELPTKWWKRLFAVLLGVGMVSLGHAAGVTDFGPGPDGMLRAAFFGICAGGLASVMHQALISKWLPFLKKKNQ